MRGEKRIPVERHPKPYRFLHWLIVAEMFILLITGLNLSEGFNLAIVSRSIARPVHIVVAFAWLATVVLFIYYFIMIDEYRWFGLARLGRAIDAFVEEIRAFLKGEKLPEPIRYDPRKGEYVEKTYPTEVLAWWLWVLIWFILATTGLALLFPSNFGLVNRFWHAVIADYEKATEATRAAHYLTAIAVIVVVLIHGYLVILTGIWRSIIFGTREEPIVESE